MTGGRRKSRKPQKWEDFVADEEQLASLEQELEQEEVARMQSVEEGAENQDSSDDEVNLEIVMEDDENGNIKMEGEEEEEEEEEEEDVEETGDGNKENGEGDEDTVKGGEQLSAPSVAAVGDCTTCGIQLRDWPTTHNHLRFHRLSHVPDCITKAPSAMLTKRIICQVCQRSCQTKEVLAYHAYTEHYARLRHSKTCPFCCSSFSCLDEFLDHLDITNVSFHCEMCGMTATQEHKFYQHIVYCSKKHHSGLSSLPCCVCGTVTKIYRLYDHLTQHSTQLNLTRHLYTSGKIKHIVEPCPPKQQTRFRPFLCEMCDRRFVVYSEYKRHLQSHAKTRAYVCTHCGRSYCQKNTLIVHLYSYHNSSPNAEEVMPREDQTQRQCESCGCIGFLSEELLVRHCVMRCPRRNNLQASFAVIVASIAKNQNSSFAETLHSPAMVTYLKLGLEAWQTPICVKNYLEALQSAASSDSSDSLAISPTDLTTSTSDLTTAVTRKDSVEFTDIQLLAYLTQFEEKNREDREMDMAMNVKGKSESEREDRRGLQAEDRDEDPDEGGGEDSPLPFPCSTTPTSTSPPATSCSPPLPFPSTSTPQINHTSLMQHLRRGADKNTGEQQGSSQGEEVSPVDICLVTSTTNTQVTITPAGHHLTQDMQPPKIADALPHKPSVAEIRAQYPGVMVFADVDFSRMPFLLMEMRENMSDRVERAMEGAGFTAQDLQRLEVEGQLLREAEPFYLEDFPVKEEKERIFSTSPPSPTILQHLAAEIEEMLCGNGEENYPQSSVNADSVHNGTERKENCHDVIPGNIDAPHVSPRRKRVKRERETGALSPVLEKGAGRSGSPAPTLAPQGPFFPPKKLLDRLLREAQMLGDG